MPATRSRCCRLSAAVEMIALSHEPIDPAALLRDFSRGLDDAGAIASFVGLVRKDGDEAVEALVLDHRRGFTEAAIAGAAADAAGRWPLRKIMIVHRVGRVAVGDAVVFVATAAAHRRAAFEACDFLMDFLKTDAPFWKKQIGRSGERWIEPSAGDYSDRARWNMKDS